MKSATYRQKYRQFLERLKSARKEARLTQMEVSERISRPQSFISKVESGERRLDIIELAEIARVYKKAIDYFLS